MANHASAEKKLRRDQRKRQVNIARVSRIRTYVKKAEESLRSQDVGQAGSAVRQAQSELMRGVTKGVLHKNTASRKVSRLALKLAALGN